MTVMDERWRRTKISEPMLVEWKAADAMMVGKTNELVRQGGQQVAVCTVYRLNMDSWNIWLAPPCE